MTVSLGSPSSRRAWIEMLEEVFSYHTMFKSPSSRRAWIEILARF